MPIVHAGGDTYTLTTGEQTTSDIFVSFTAGGGVPRHVLSRLPQNHVAHTEHKTWIAEESTTSQRLCACTYLQYSVGLTLGLEKGDFVVGRAGQ